MNTTVQIAGRNISDNYPDGIVIEISCGKEDFEISIPESSPGNTDTFLSEQKRKDEIINYLKTEEFLLYIHGFGSRFKPDSDKMKALEKVLPVIGLNLDYSSDFETISSQIYSVILNFDVMLIAGTSLGGYWAAKKGADAGIPFVAMNPAIEPKKTLRKYIG